MIDLHFLNSEQRKGLNLTIRSTDKWFTKTHTVERGHPIRLFVDDPKSGDFKKFGGASFVGSLKMRYTRIPPEFLKFEHDSKCRSKGGLFKAMKRAYGKAFTRNSIVTLLFYTDVEIDGEIP